MSINQHDGYVWPFFAQGDGGGIHLLPSTNTRGTPTWNEYLGRVGCNAHALCGGF